MKFKVAESPLTFPMAIVGIALLFFLFSGEPDVVETVRDYVIEKYTVSKESNE